MSEPIVHTGLLDAEVVRAVQGGRPVIILGRRYVCDKPDEPTNLGAIVEDIDGNPWVRADHGENAWVYGMSGWRAWDEINVARIVSEGVQS